METSNQFLGTERIGRLMKQYAIPCIISLLVGALYNIVDQIFIANASYLGSYGNAANTVVFPLTVVALAIAVMVGDGCCAFVSIQLGKGKLADVKKSVGSSVLMILAASFVLMAVYLMFADGIIAMFGQAMNPIIRADGSPKFAMISTLTGAVVNIILDPIFIFLFQWGMMGAAVATVIGQAVTAVLAVWYLMHMKNIKPAKSDYALNISICGKTLLLGITSFLSQISLVAAMAAINNMLRKYGALDPVFSQAQYAQIPMAVVGFNIGAGQNKRVKELFTKLLTAEAAVGAAAMVLVEFFPRQLILVFGAANESVYYTDPGSGFWSRLRTGSANAVWPGRRIVLYASI